MFEEIILIFYYNYSTKHFLLDNLLILEISNDMKVLVNSSITIFCKAFGNPPPSIEWQSSHDLVNESIFEEVHENHIAISILRLAVTKDAAFNCSAWNNQADTAMKSTSITVQGIFI